MTGNVDLSILDRPEILALIFYPRRSHYVKTLGSNVENHLVQVDEDIHIGCRFYKSRRESPSMLYFHGNGEIAEDYDWSAPSFNEAGVNLFVADYRGYGFSNGTPTLTNMMKDAHAIFTRFKEIIVESDVTDQIFVMGRSIGSLPATELAYHYQRDIRGLIIESGSANSFLYFFDSLIPPDHPIRGDNNIFLNKVRLRSVTIPTLIIHAEYDTLVPLEEGKELYANSAAKDKEFVIIPNADHNDLMATGRSQYFNAIKKFIAEQDLNSKQS